MPEMDGIDQRTLPRMKHAPSDRMMGQDIQLWGPAQIHNPTSHGPSPEPGRQHFRVILGPVRPTQGPQKVQLRELEPMGSLVNLALAQLPLASKRNQHH